MNIRVCKIGLLDSDKKLLREVEFSLNKVNLIIGEPSTGKTQLISLIRYGLFHSGGNIDKQLIGNKIAYVMVTIAVNGVYLTNIRFYSKGIEKTSKCIFFKTQSPPIYLQKISQLNFDNPDSERFYWEFLGKLVNFSKKYESYDDNCTLKNMFTFNYLNYTEVANPSIFINKGNIIESKFSKVKEVAYGMVNIKNILEKSQHADYLGDKIVYDEFKNLIKEFRERIDGLCKGDDSYMEKIQRLKSGISYSTAPSVLQIHEDIKDLEKKYADLIIELELAKKMKDEDIQYEINVLELIEAASVSEEFEEYSVKEYTNFLTLKKEYISNLNLYINSKESNLNHVANNIENLAALIRKKESTIHEYVGKNEVEKLVAEINEYSKIINRVIDFKPIKLIGNPEIMKFENIVNKKIKFIFQELESLDHEVFKSLTGEKTLYKFKQNKLSIVDSSQTVAMEHTGSSTKYSFRNIAAQMAVISSSPFIGNFFVVDQPLQAIEDTDQDIKLNNVKRGMYKMLSSVARDASNPIQMIIVTQEKPSEELIKNENLNIAVQLTEENKLIPDDSF